VQTYTVKLPEAMNDLTAELELQGKSTGVSGRVFARRGFSYDIVGTYFKMMRNSAISAPAINPAPTPAVPIADGADHDPSASRAITNPDPALIENKKPAYEPTGAAEPAHRVSLVPPGPAGAAADPIQY